MWMEKQRQTGKLLLITACTLSVVACHKHDSKTAQPKNQQIVTAKLQTPIQRLYYSGTLSPIASKPVVAPVSGNVDDMHFTYGEKIQAGKDLIILESKSLADKYRNAVTSFLQKKQSYTNQKLSFEGTKALYSAGIYPESQYTSEKSQLEDSTLDFMQSRFQLEKVLRMANLSVAKTEALSISDTEEINKILQRHFKHIVIKAPISGIALYPTGDGDSSKRIAVGDSIKESQLLLLIGDLTGLSAKFSVSEVDIDRIKKNMVVKVTSNAFPNIVLQGFVSAVSSQAMQNNDGSGISMFLVSVKIPKLSDLARKKIRIGMTAKFEIDIKGAKQVMLPVNAVYQKNGLPVVTLLEKNGQHKVVPVITGNTTPTSVVILNGVKPGDQVVVHD